MSKQAIRQQILLRLNEQKEKDKFEKSLLIQQKLFSKSWFKSANVIMFYASFDGEVDTVYMIEQAQLLGKRIILPRIDKTHNALIPVEIKDLKKDLEIGPFGIKQPKRQNTKAVDINSLKVVVVPGIAFDRKNNRLGRGGGYYDRFLKQLPVACHSVGLAFDFQIVDCLPPIEEHDVSVTHVLSN